MNAMSFSGQEHNMQDDQKQQTLARLEAEMVKGLESGPSTPMTQEDWQTIREEVRRRSATS